jgi:hypothetical protein
MQAAEALQLYLELCGDESIRATRWRPVIRTLLTRSNPSCPDQLAAIYKAIALTPEEKATFKWVAVGLQQCLQITLAQEVCVRYVQLRAITWFWGKGGCCSRAAHTPAL